MSRVHYVVIAMLGVGVACGDRVRESPTAPSDPPTSAPAPGPVPEIAIGAAAILEWNDLTTRFVDSMSAQWPAAPTSEAMLYATVSVAVHDAVNAISPRYEHYAYAPLTRVTTEISVEAAIATAAYTVLRDAGDKLANAPVNPTAAPLELATWHYAAVVNAIPEGAAKDSGIALGARAARALLEWRRADDVNVAPFARFVSSGRPGVYRPTPPFSSDPDQLSGVIDGRQWLGARPLVVSSLIEFRPPTPYGALTVEDAVVTDAYTADFLEVKRIGGALSHRTIEQTDVLHFWRENSPRLWNQIARQLVLQQEFNGWDVARTLALASLAEADSYLAAFDAIYTHTFWRPLTAIRLAGDDRNDMTTADSAWEPASSRFDAPTPPTPEYSSAHAAAGGAAAEVLHAVLEESVPFTVERASAPVTLARSFESVRQAAQEGAESGVLLGHHFRTATKVGLDQGARIGRTVITRALRPLPQQRADR